MKHLIKNPFSLLVGLLVVGAIVAGTTSAFSGSTDTVIEHAENVYVEDNSPVTTPDPQEFGGSFGPSQIRYDVFGSKSLSSTPGSNTLTYGFLATTTASTTKSITGLADIDLVEFHVDVKASSTDSEILMSVNQSDDGFNWFPFPFSQSGESVLSGATTTWSFVPGTTEKKSTVLKLKDVNTKFLQFEIDKAGTESGGQVFVEFIGKDLD